MADTLLKAPRRLPASPTLHEPAPGRRGEYRMTFTSLAPTGLLGSLINTDVTNPRELYSMLSESRQQELLASLTAPESSPAVKLPPLLQTPEEGTSPSSRHANKHSSFPDLRVLDRSTGHRHQQKQRQLRHRHASSDPNIQNSISLLRQASSLQDVSTAVGEAHGTLQVKTIKPILKTSDRKHLPGDDKVSKPTAAESSGVKFENLVSSKDLILPPIDGMERQHPSAHDSLGISYNINPLNKRKDNDQKYVSEVVEGETFIPLSRSLTFLTRGLTMTSTMSRPPEPQLPRFLVPGPIEVSLFPRGQVRQAKRPRTPTFDTYPDAYWALRSPTVQVPSDLKEDMIDRDRYRLQQISTLRLRAINRDATPSKHEQFLKWQQQQLLRREQQETNNGSVISGTTSADRVLTENANGAPSSAAPVDNKAAATTSSSLAAERPAGQKPKWRRNPAHDQGLGLSSSPVSFSQHSPASRRGSNYNQSGGKMYRSEEPSSAFSRQQQSSEPTTEEGQKRGGRTRGASRPIPARHVSSDDNGSKMPKAAVINLSIEPDCQSSFFAAGPETTSIGKFVKEGTSYQGHGQSQVVPGQTFAAAKSESGAVGDGIGGSPDTTQAVIATSSHCDVTKDNNVNDEVSKGNDQVAGGGSGSPGKCILTRFKRLEVFSEKSLGRTPTNRSLPASDDGTAASLGNDNPILVQQNGHSGENTTVKPTARQRPYLPQTRPPTYKLDTRLGGAQLHRPLAGTTAQEGRGRARQDGAAAVASVSNSETHASRHSVSPHILRRKSPDHKAKVVKFRFQNGEVIVSREGRKKSPVATTTARVPAKIDDVDVMGRTENITDDVISSGDVPVT